MQSKGFIQFLVIVLAIAVIYHLSFTFVVQKVKKDAKDFAKGNPKLEQRYLDSVANQHVFNILIKKFTFRECQEREINLGLDLKGGMNVTLEISVEDVIRALAHNTTDTTFNKAIKLAKELQKTSGKDFVSLFGEAFKQIDPTIKLASYFYSKNLKIDFNTPNEEVLNIIKKEVESAVDNSYNVLRNRIDRFGVIQPNIQKSDITGRIILELPGIKDPERVRKLLQGTANLEFWTTFENEEIYQYLEKANNLIAQLSTQTTETKDTTLIAQADTTSADSLDLLQKLKATKDTSKSIVKNTKEEFQKKNPLFSILYPNIDNQGRLLKGSIVGLALGRDTPQVNKYLSLKQVKALFPSNLKFYWSFKPIKNTDVFYLHAIKVDPRLQKAPLDGSVITTAKVDFNNITNEPEVTMSMNAEGAREWARLTRENIGKQIAIILDNYVYSAPVVRQEIKGGNSSISGGFTIEEATDLANVLNSGKMPAPAIIIEEAIVGPTLGKESINAGFISFIIAFVCVLLYMILFYGRTGLIADVALFFNAFLLIGVLASLGAVLTLPGIAGIVLTLGMAVDANVIIYERIREELKEGKGIKLAIADGFKNSYSAIIDANITTLITGIVLYAFGSGPIRGFASTLTIGVLTSLFSAIFVTRLIFEFALRKNWSLNFDTNLTKNILQNININFLKLRKLAYIISSAIILIGVISIIFKGLSFSVDFLGGRTYIVRFDKEVKVADVRKALSKTLGEAPQVKTFGANDQVKITTKYLVNENSAEADSIVEAKIYEGAKTLFNKKISYEEFTKSTKESSLGILSSTKVGPTIADDIKIGAVIALFVALLVIFIYIVFRFRKWQWALGGVVALFHDSMIVLGLFSIFNGVLPFNLEIDQAFIAAILTVIGYSINDTVIIFDRIREHIRNHPLWELDKNINTAINTTLRRTMNTSLTTLIVLIIIFIFGGEVLRGFIFAILIGVFVGTYSSVFIASAIAYDILKNKKNEKK
ncbi:MAG: protein translocase subunit SecDF [Bacteroidales bacterium]|nr:protein translocase subunit SecDF [Bacteroidales bacterium]